MELIIKQFNELSVYELYEILKLRSSIFIVEQNCIYNDLDDKDLVSHHLYLKDNNEIIAYLRCIPKNISYDMASIGRVVSKYRHNGNAKMLVLKGIDFIFNNYDTDEIIISSQKQASLFYEKCGFKYRGDYYLEDDIVHIQMYIRKNG